MPILNEFRRSPSTGRCYPPGVVYLTETAHRPRSTPALDPDVRATQRQAQAERERAAATALAHLKAVLGVPDRPTNPDVERFMLDCGVKFGKR
jgi:hypothetical protein